MQGCVRLQHTSAVTQMSNRLHGYCLGRGEHVQQMMGGDIAGVGQIQIRAAPGIRVPGGQPGYPAGTVCRGCMCSARPASDGLMSLTSPSTTARALLGWRTAWPTATSTPLCRWAHPAHNDNNNINGRLFSSFLKLQGSCPTLDAFWLMMSWV